MLLRIQANRNGLDDMILCGNVYRVDQYSQTSASAETSTKTSDPIHNQSAIITLANAKE
jgi:hypothetical protein